MTPDPDPVAGPAPYPAPAKPTRGADTAAVNPERVLETRGPGCSRQAGTDPDPDLGTPVPDMRATGATLRLTTRLSLEDEPALYQAGVRPDPATTTTRTTRGTAAAAAAAVRGAAVEAPVTEASPEGSTGLDGKKPSTINYLISVLLIQLSHVISCTMASRAFFFVYLK
jgi:hypothetical protein